MPLELARRLGAALDVRSETKIRQIDRAMQGYVRFTPQSPGTSVPGSIDASQVITGEFADARISESSVVQHEAALEIDWLQLAGVPATFPPSAHNHNASDLNAGTLADARVAQSNVTQHQAALALAATQLTSGVLADARVQQSNVTQHEAALDIDWLQLTGVPSTFTPADHLQTGSWTPVDASGAGLSITVNSASYVKHESLVIARCSITYPATANAAGAVIGGLPFALISGNSSVAQGFITYSTTAGGLFILPNPGASSANFYANPGGAAAPNSALNGATLWLTMIYTT